MARLTKTGAIKKFLQIYAKPDLAEMYGINMECQVNVRAGDGERITGQFKGKDWQGFSDGVETWKPFRIPWKAYGDPEFTDSNMNWNLEKHVDGIGMTGWDWMERCSRWVAYDFDALMGHSEKHLAKLTADEMDEVKNAATNLPYVSVRKSSSGNGLHLYVEIDRERTENHHEHAALARAILAKMSLDANYNFEASVDICGGNMWVWHRKGEGKDEAFKLVKQGGILEEVPKNWRDHIKVTKGKRRKSLPQEVEKIEDDFDLLVGRSVKADLDQDHKDLLQFLADNDAVWWWDNDNHMLVTHTWWLNKAQRHFNYVGMFHTDSKGSDKNEQNCFCFPMKNGAWGVRRFTPGCGEHESWEQDSAGWTRTFLNREPDLKTAARAFDAVEDLKGNFNFDEAEVAIKTMGLLGVQIDIDKKALNNTAQIKKHKDGRLVMSIDIDKGKVFEMKGWHLDKNKYVKIFSAKGSNLEETKGQLYDDSIRFLIESNGGYSEIGWYSYIQETQSWVNLTASSMKMMLKHLGLKASEVDEAMGASIARPWKNVVEPFQPEYPGERSWNRSGARLRFTPAEEDIYHTPTWDLIFNQLGAEIDDAVHANTWCADNGINSGADYLRVWCASLFQKPKSPLPYLFFYSSAQNTGKSTLSDALSKLMTRGCVRASACLDPSNTFNGELDGAVLCIVEETELDKSNKVYGRLKDWVTSPDLGIHPKGGTPYTTINTTHWIHTANSHNACPVFAGDTRIVVVSVKPLSKEDEIPKEELMYRLEVEAPQFLGQVMSIKIPDPNGRLAIPCIQTAQKSALTTSNLTSAQMFFNNMCERNDGVCIKANALLAAFHAWLGDEAECAKYTPFKFYKELPPEFPKGYGSWGGGNYIPNLKVREDAELFVPDAAYKSVKPGTKLVINIKGLIVTEDKI